MAGVGQAAGAPTEAAASPPGKYLPPLPARSQGPGETAVTPVLEGSFGAQGAAHPWPPLVDSTHLEHVLGPGLKSWV